MNNRLAEELNELLKGDFPAETVKIFREKLAEGELTRDENPRRHFCAFFAAYDQGNKKVFIGDHKKSGLWLFNGGHIDRGESLNETVKREISEEWGLDANDLIISAPSFLTLAEIDNPLKQTCRLHFDIWHFVKVNLNSFNPNQEKLLKEFHRVEWLDLKEAREKVIDPGTLEALDFIEKKLF